MWPVDHVPLSNHPAFRNKFQKLATAQRARGSYSTLFEHKSSQEFQSDTIFLGVTPQYGLLPNVWVTMSKYSSWGQFAKTAAPSSWHDFSSPTWNHTMRVTQLDAYRGGRFVQVEVNFWRCPPRALQRMSKDLETVIRISGRRSFWHLFLLLQCRMHVTVREILLSSWIFLNS